MWSVDHQLLTRTEKFYLLMAGLLVTPSGIMVTPQEALIQPTGMYVGPAGIQVGPLLQMVFVDRIHATK